MNPDNYIFRVYSQNKHLNEIEHKYSNLFGDDRLNSGENALQKGNNAQSLKTLLKYPLINALPIRIKNSSSAERENKDLENDGQNFRKFNVLPYISPFSNFQQNLLPTISVKITKKKKFTKESPYAFKANKKESEKRISQLKQKNFNKELQDFILTAKTIKITVPHENKQPIQTEQSKLDYFNKIASQSNLIKPQQPFKFYIGEGNNGELVRKILNETRSGYWKETNLIKGVIHFKWQQNTKEFKYDRLNSNALYKQMVNHFEFHREISTKAGLFKNLRFFCEKNQIPLSEITPPTFFFDLEEEDLESNIQSFLNFYYRYLPVDIKEPRKSFLNINKFPNKLSINAIKEDLSPYTCQIMPETFQICDNYFWLFKPNGLNRGRGIKVFNRIDQLESFLNEIMKEHDENRKKPLDEKLFKLKQDNNKKMERLVQNYKGIKKIKKNGNPNKVFIVQKYIENPLLINQRKFDVRVWSLITHTLDFYFFKEGYVRTSSEKFDLSLGEMDNFYIHLTNNAVQKNNENYGKFENGNQISFEDLENLVKVEKNIELNFKQKMIPRMKELIKTSLLSVRKKLNKEDRKYCFEIFGYDFIIDANLNVWLIEVNTNPCIETSSPLLEMYLPRMIDDAFKLTIDKIFPKFTNNSENKNLGDIKNEKVEEITALYKIKGHNDEENLWEYLGNLRNGEN